MLSTRFSKPKHNHTLSMLSEDSKTTIFYRQCTPFVIGFFEN